MFPVGGGVTLGRAGERHACVVDEDVDAAVPLLHGGDQRIDAVHIAHVTGLCPGAVAIGLQLLRGLLARCGVELGDDGGGAGCAEGAGDAEADAAPGAGQDGDAPRQFIVGRGHWRRVWFMRLEFPVHFGHKIDELDTGNPSLLTDKRDSGLLRR